MYSLNKYTKQFVLVLILVSLPIYVYIFGLVDLLLLFSMTVLQCIGSIESVGDYGEIVNGKDMILARQFTRRILCTKTWSLCYITNTVLIVTKACIRWQRYRRKDRKSTKNQKRREYERCVCVCWKPVHSHISTWIFWRRENCNASRFIIMLFGFPNGNGSRKSTYKQTFRCIRLYEVNLNVFCFASYSIWIYSLYGQTCVCIKRLSTKSNHSS